MNQVRGATTSLSRVLHGYRRMTGRDPDESHRAASTLELLYDLVFVICFSVSGSNFAHLVGEGDVVGGLVGFGLAMVIVIWGWTSFTWFASAYDTDDWIYRLLVMAQMVGVVILTFGLEAMFDAIAHHQPAAIAAIVVGYGIMRIPLVLLWIRLAIDQPQHRTIARDHALAIALALIGWGLSTALRISTGWYLVIALVLISVEFVAMVSTERNRGGTPWNAHHIAERYGLLTIIAFGEVLLGTVEAMGGVIASRGWVFELILDALVGVALTFGLWWSYFNLATADALKMRRRRAIGWSLLHTPIFLAIAAIGAGLHVLSLRLLGEVEVDRLTVIIAIAIPVVVYLVSLAAVTSYLLPVGRISTGVLAIQLMWCALAVGVVAAGSTVLIGSIFLTAAAWTDVAAQELGVGRLRQRAVTSAIESPAD